MSNVLYNYCRRSLYGDHRDWIPISRRSEGQCMERKKMFGNQRIQSLFPNHRVPEFGENVTLTVMGNTCHCCDYSWSGWLLMSPQREELQYSRATQIYCTKQEPP